MIQLFNSIQNSKIIRKKVLFLLIICAVFFQCKENSKKPVFTVRNGVIHCKSGLPQQPLWFADSRLNFSFLLCNAFHEPAGICNWRY